ncbi:MAG TPA: tRNA pseudouridine(55) synthase TruB [Thermoanaerobaculia bacterium]|jgi:tRNA pseudouridine55 synthase|nr:tRNA pseudouridine(55) synthase TruB [Thermoanaerobaculia bacterium]
MKDGLLLIDKETGCTSHDVVQKARRILKEKKIGHCGTLDPDATGLLLLTVGTATRLTRFLIRAPKVYEGTIRFGAATDTYDAAGQVTAEHSIEGLTLNAIETEMARFVGTFEQTTPPYSAKKVGGVKLYEMARRGEEVPIETKEITVYEFAPTSALVDGSIDFRLACTSGTYARTLAHDVGQALGCGAHLSALRRIKIGTFGLEQAVTLGVLADRLAGAPTLSPAPDDAAAEPTAGRPATAGSLTASAGSAWIPFDQIPLPFGAVTADTQQEQRIRHGQTVLVRELAGDEGDWVELRNRRSQLVAVGTIVERIGSGGTGIVQPKVVF